MFLQKHIDGICSSEWGLFDMLVAAEAYNRPISLAVHSDEGRPWVWKDLRQMLAPVAGENFATLPPLTGEPIHLLPTTAWSGKFNGELSEMSHWEPLVVLTWNDTDYDPWEKFYNSRKLFEEASDQWKNLMRADESVYGSSTLKQTAVRQERSAMIVRCRAWADQALAIYEDLRVCPVSVAGDGKCGASSIHVAITCQHEVSNENQGSVHRIVQIAIPKQQMCTK